MDKIYQELFKKIYRYAYFRLWQKEDAEDVAAETIKRIFQKGDIKNISDITQWTYGVARNVLKEKYRDRAGRTISGFDSIKYQESDYDIGTENLDSQIDDEKMLDAALTVLKSMPDEIKEIIVMKLWENFKFKDIAKLMREKENTVKQRFYRGLEFLKKKLKENYKFALLPAVLMALLTKVEKAKALAVDPAAMQVMLGNVSIIGTGNAHGTGAGAGGAGVAGAAGMSIGVKIGIVAGIILLTTAVGAVILIGTSGGVNEFVTRVQNVLPIFKQDGNVIGPTVPPVSPTEETVEGIDTSSWKIYTNDEYGFSFKYPAEGTVQPRPLKSCDNSTFPAKCVTDGFHIDIAVPNKGALAFYYYSSQWAKMTDIGEFDKSKVAVSPITLFGREGKKGDILCHGDGMYTCEYVKDGTGIRYTIYYYELVSSKKAGNLNDPKGRPIALFSYGKSSPIIDKIVESIEYK